MAKDKKNSSFLEKLQRKYRLVIINDETFEQKTSIKLTKFNLYIGAGSILLMIIVLVTSLIAFTNIKYYLPGVGRIDFRNQISNLYLETDSLTRVLNQRNSWINNVQKIISGETDSLFTLQSDSAENINIDSIDLNYIPEEDKQLRAEVENQKDIDEIDNKIKNDLSHGSDEVFTNLKLKMLLGSPINGVIVQPFSTSKNHIGIDIAGKENESIKAIYEGVVFLSEWNPKTGHVIAIQHPGNMISFYKHNSVLLKKRGTFVKKGEVIAIIGNSGEYSTGPHLHFELWRNGKTIDPSKFINIESLN